MSTTGSKLDLDRLIFFSDGVFAIAITLLALDLRLPPHDGPMTSAALAQALIRTLPRLGTFFLSFQVIGVFWLAHHRMFSMIRGFDRRLALLNLLFLMTIAFLPFPTALIGEYISLTPAAVLYGASLVATSATANLLWAYAARGRRMIAPEATEADVRASTVRGLVTLILFLLSIPVAFVRPGLAPVAWALTAFTTPLAERWARRL
jgi:uncharacterized membrane protein